MTKRELIEAMKDADDNATLVVKVYQWDRERWEEVRIERVTVD